MEYMYLIAWFLLLFFVWINVGSMIYKQRIPTLNSVIMIASGVCLLFKYGVI